MTRQRLRLVAPAPETWGALYFRWLWRVCLVGATCAIHFVPEHTAHAVCVAVCQLEVIRLGWRVL